MNFKTIIAVLVLIFIGIEITILYLAMCKVANKADKSMNRYWKKHNIIPTPINEVNINNAKCRLPENSKSYMTCGLCNFCLECPVSTIESKKEPEEQKRLELKEYVKMKLYNVKNLEGLFSVIDKCEGRIELVGEDICINLKSKLAQYFALADVFSAGDEVIKELELKTYNAADTEKIMNFLIGGEV